MMLLPSFGRSSRTTTINLILSPSRWFAFSIFLQLSIVDTFLCLPGFRTLMRVFIVGRLVFFSIFFTTRLSYFSFGRSRGWLTLDVGDAIFLIYRLAQTVDAPNKSVDRRGGGCVFCNLTAPAILD